MGHLLVHTLYLTMATGSRWSRVARKRERSSQKNKLRINCGSNKGTKYGPHRVEMAVIYPEMHTHLRELSTRASVSSAGGRGWV